MRTIHYGLARFEQASKAGNHPSCWEDRLYALCGNGDYYATTTREFSEVTCAACAVKRPFYKEAEQKE